MNEYAKSYRLERIERLLDELRYEVTRGMMEGEIDEALEFGFVIPVSKTIRSGVVWCQFRTRPTLGVHVTPDAVQPGGKLRAVK